MTMEILFVCLFCKCYNFGEDVISGLGSEGNFMWTGGGIKSVQMYVCLHCKGRKPASVNSEITGAILKIKVPILHMSTR